MMLVEAPEETETNTQTKYVIRRDNDPQSYLRSETIPNLDSELKEILEQRDIPDRQKWQMYNQTLQRYLFFLNQEKSKNSFNSMLRRYSPFNKAPVVDWKPQFRNIYEPSIPKQRDQDVHPLNFDDNESENTIDEIPSLPEHDSDLENEQIYDENDIAIRGKKRNASEETIPHRKVNRNSKIPIYNWMPRPALNRWELEQKNKAKMAKQNRLLKAYSELKSEAKPEQMDTQYKYSNKRPHVNNFYDFDHAVEEQSVAGKRPKIHLNRNEFDRLLEEYAVAGSSYNNSQSGGSIHSIERILKWDKP